MNFGHKLTIAMGLFMGFLIFMAVKSFQQNFDLVTEDYYQKEIEFQNIINKKKNASEFADKISIENTGVHLSVKLPESLKNIKGTAHLFRPSDKKLDQKIDFEGNILTINKKLLTKGKYLLILDFTDGQKEFFIEKPVFI
jgi:hypothetical protein